MGEGWEGGWRSASPQQGAASLVNSVKVFIYLSLTAISLTHLTFLAVYFVPGTGM